MSTPEPAVKRQTGSLLLALIEGMRPSHWVKNAFVFAALIFSRSLADWHRNVLVLAAAVAYCLSSSAIYLLNDIADASEDRNHPAKRHRPIASGRLPVKAAATAACLLIAVSLLGGWCLDRRFCLILAVYIAVNIVYSWFLKRVPLVDVFAVAAGFVLRVLGGAVVIHVAVSPWLIVCTTLLSLFLALSKRRHELVVLGKEAPTHRMALASYSPYLLDQLIGIVTASTLMSYALYTLAPDVKARFPGKRLEFTIPFVLFGIFRYLYLIHQGNEGGSPTKLLLTDGVLLSVVLLWSLSVTLIIYF